MGYDSEVACIGFIREEYHFEMMSVGGLQWCHFVDLPVLQLKRKRKRARDKTRWPRPQDGITSGSDARYAYD